MTDQQPKPPAVHISITLEMQESGHYGLVWSVDGASGGCKDTRDPRLPEAFKTITRTLIRELRRVAVEANKPAGKGKRALRKAKREGKLDVTPKTDADTPDPTDEVDIIILPDDPENPPC